MHELTIAESIIGIISEEMSKHHLSKVDSISLRIGEMRQVVQETLMFSFECLSKNTPLEGTKINIEFVSLRGRCNSCNKEFSLEHYFNNCPYCNHTKVDVISGKELDIIEFEGE